MLKRKTIVTIVLGSLLSVAVLAPASADQERGKRHNPGGSEHASAHYLKTHHPQNLRGHSHRRPGRIEYRLAYRNDHRHWRDHRHNGSHGHYRHYRHGHDHEFANGLIFGGILGYVVGSDY
ncbi:MAG: hypothetical protein KDI74_11115 [Gammaproteobacteria bacterium]|nr:hypothetical protein [Gammaproteobacteria bacterium]HXK55426.1 hypothetical protein [Gammaproteobacteria bacterium]